MREAREQTPPLPETGEWRLLPAEFADLDQLIRFCWERVAEAALAHGLGPQQGGIQLALREALCNAYRHGNRQDPSQPIHFTWQCHGPELTCTVRDSGAGFDPGQLPDPTCPENRDRDHGRGVFIIRALARAVTWQEEGRQVTMFFSAAGQP